VTIGKDPSQEPGAPRSARSAGVGARLYSALVSPRLAIGLLIVVLICCVLGVTVVRGPRAGQLIFATLWFNGLLVLLAISSAAAFFSRAWKRKLTLLSVGMILFHLSFASMLAGIVYNQLFYFDGVLRLTEGETLPNGRIESYDQVDMGRFFDPGTLRGETTLVKMHVNYRVQGENKRAAYEVAINDGETMVRRLIWITEYLDFRGVRYFCQKEGYSVLLVMSDAKGNEIFGAHVPLQSYRQGPGSYTYAAGSPTAPEPFGFPQGPSARAAIELSYRPNAVDPRKGDVALKVWEVRPGAEADFAAAPRTATVHVGETQELGGLRFSPREVRYWVGMNVRYDPGLTVVMASLTLGLLGMVLTFVGRLRQGAGRKRAA
jgi:hypothetical protein